MVTKYGARGDSVIWHLTKRTSVNSALTVEYSLEFCIVAPKDAFAIVPVVPLVKVATVHVARYIIEFRLGALKDILPLLRGEI
jgi:hypothetical protein